MNPIILIKLIAAHLAGDFILQSDRMCADKFSCDSFTKYMALASHALIQAALAYVFVSQWSNWVVPLIIGISHFAIDWIKTMCKDRNLISFVWDQFAHLSVITGLWWFTFVGMPQPDMACEILSVSFWLIATAYLSVLAPASILIKSFIEYEKWMPADSVAQGLPNAGKWIGYLERILILTFIFTGNIEGIGFLLAAKSVFRFGELNKAKDIKITEYVLIGTFASFTIAILIGFGVKWLVGMNFEA
ncbi:MAG: DUF3307 domain-containing protein [Muribaculaceae bacterium]|nr:DUF3307 domain-containing protein [Muribaculaceae bacterium]